ncbi:MAG: CoA-binding protein [Ignavibacteriaceae bacterium]|nr:CoA-binding protein [Ignavibacteriaceae bacterium]
MNQKAAEFAMIKNLAIAGVSRSGNKFGNAILKELVKRGCEMFPVHHEADSIDGHKCYRSLSELKGSAEGLIVCVKPEKVPALLEESAQSGIKKVWIQQGASSAAAASKAASLGLEVVDGKCILMYAGDVRGIHKFHRTVAGWFGRV